MACLLACILTGYTATAQITLDRFLAAISAGEEGLASEDASMGLHATVSNNDGSATQDTTVTAELGMLSIVSSASSTAVKPASRHADSSSGVFVDFTITEPLQLTTRGSISNVVQGQGDSNVNFQITDGVKTLFRVYHFGNSNPFTASVSTSINLAPGSYSLYVTAGNEVSSNNSAETAASESWNFTLKLGKPSPVIFLHGIAGSELMEGDEKIWPTIFAADVRKLALIPGSPELEAVDVVRKFAGSNFYGLFLEHMVMDLGYKEFDLAGDRSRLTSDAMLTGWTGSKPTLFVFPYDWRKSNTTQTATLNQYIKKIRQLHNDAKVNIVAHSMGGLVARRYLLEFGTEDVGKLVTVGSPLLGAVKPFYLMHTGEFYENVLDSTKSDDMIASLATMPGLHELMASPLYLSNAASSVFSEVGFDLNENDDAFEDYNRGQLYSRMDALVAPVPSPSLTNQTFHNFQGGRQDDWSTDASGRVKFLHFVGVQQVKKTTVKVLATSVIERPFFGPPTQSVKFIAVPGDGDGTVPVLSARRLPQFLAPGAIIREIHEPNPGVDSDKQPAGRSAEHTGLMSNTEVWAAIQEFFESGTLANVQSSPTAPRQTAALRTVATAASSPEVAEGPPGDSPEIEVEEPVGTILVQGGACRAFGTVDLSSSSAVATYTIRNTGGADLTGLSATRDGLNPKDFTIGSPGMTTLRPGESTTFTVAFTPTPAGGHRGGPRSESIHIISNDLDESSFDICLTGNVTAGRKEINLVGASYVKFRDALGNTNTKVSDIAATHVPGVEVHYGGSKPWMDLSFSADDQITLESDLSGNLVDMKITEFDSAGTAFSLKRYRFVPNGHSWQTIVSSGLAPDQRLDLNDDKIFGAEELVAPASSSTGDSVDTTPPTIVLNLTQTEDTIVMNLSGSDGAQPLPSLHYSLDGSSILNYSSALVFPRGVAHAVKAFAEDSTGNTSGMIETTINPAVDVASAPAGTITLEWPVSDGYILEESPTMTDPWPTSTSTVIRSGLINRVTLPIESSPIRFFRLRSAPVER